LTGELDDQKKAYEKLKLQLPEKDVNFLLTEKDAIISNLNRQLSIRKEIRGSLQTIGAEENIIWIKVDHASKVELMFCDKKSIKTIYDLSARIEEKYGVEELFLSMDDGILPDNCEIEILDNGDLIKVNLKENVKKSEKKEICGSLQTIGAEENNNSANKSKQESLLSKDFRGTKENEDMDMEPPQVINNLPSKIGLQ
jgi:hypothetical protein